jgi:hypothetical protein
LVSKTRTCFIVLILSAALLGIVGLASPESSYGNMLQPALVSVAPSTVGTSTYWLAVGNTQGYNQGGFYAAGRFWTWYCTGSNTILTSSVDGVSWTAPIIVKSHVASCATFSGVFDGTYFHYITSYNDNVRISYLGYRRGLPNSDGTVTWSAPEQVIDSSQGAPCGIGTNGCDQQEITVDTTGHVWIGFAQPYNDCTGCTGGWPWLMRNAATDGTWSTDNGYPLKLNSQKSGGQGTGEWGVIILRLTNGKVAILYSRHGMPFYGRLYDPPTGLGPETIVSGGALMGNNQYSSAVAVGDTVDLVYISWPYLAMRFVTGTFGGSWSDTILSPTTSNGWPDNVNLPTNLWSGTTPEWMPGLSVDGSGNLYMVWTGLPSSMAGTPFCGTYSSSGSCQSGGWWNGKGEFSIYYTEYSGGSWGPRVEYLTDNNGFRRSVSGGYHPSRENIFVFPQQFGGYIGVTYAEGGADVGVTVKFATLGEGATITTIPTSSSGSSSSRRTITSTITSTVTRTITSLLTLRTTKTTTIKSTLGSTTRTTTSRSTFRTTTTTTLTTTQRTTSRFTTTSVTSSLGLASILLLLLTLFTTRSMRGWRKRLGNYSFG